MSVRIWLINIRGTRFVDYFFVFISYRIPHDMRNQHLYLPNGYPILLKRKVMESLNEHGWR